MLGDIANKIDSILTMGSSQGDPSVSLYSLTTGSLRYCFIVKIESREGIILASWLVESQGNKS